MLRHAILRIILSLTLFLAAILVPVNIYKEDILYYILKRVNLHNTVKVQGMRGFFPFELTIERIDIGDSLTLTSLDTTLSIKKTLLQGHVRLHDLSIKEILVHKSTHSPHDSFTPIEFPDLSPLKHLDIRKFSTTFVHEDGSFKGTLTGKLKRGVLRTRYHIHRSQANYSGTLKAVSNGIEIISKVGGSPLLLQAYRHDSRHMNIRASYNTHKLKGVLESTPTQYTFEGAIDNRVHGHFSMDSGDALHINTLTCDLKDNHKLALKKPVTMGINPAMHLKEALFDLSGETLTLKDIQVGEVLKGHLDFKTSPGFWKKVNLPLTGSLTLKAELSGTQENPLGKIEVTTDKIKHATIKPLRIIKGQLRLDYKDSQSKLQWEIDGKHDLKIKGSGSIDFSQDMLLDLKTSIDLNLRHLTRIMPNHDRIDGHITGMLTLKGSPSFPTLKGHIDLKNGYFENYMIGTHIQDLQGKITIDDNQAKLTLHGKDDFKGIARAEGQITLFPLKGNIHAHLEKFYLGQSDLFTSLVTGNAVVDLEKKHVQGTLIGHRVVVDLDQLTPSSTPKINLQETVQADKSPQQTAENEFFLDLTMTPETDIIVRGFGVQSLWRGKMQLHGKRPDFIGEFTLIRGTIDILDRVMNLSRGKIIFDHDIDLPILDIDLKKKIQDFEILVNLQGRSNNPKFTFISSPALSQDEILGLILMGRRSAGGSIGQLVELSSSLSNLTNQGQDNFFGKFRKAFGIEALEIKKIEQDGTSDAGQALSVRKQINPDFTLVLEQGLSAGDTETKSTKASIEANITENVNISVDVSSNKSGGVGLNWVKRY